MSISHAIFAVGCFWGVQAAFDVVQGVVSTTVGYTGGLIKIPLMKESALAIQSTLKPY